MPGTLKLSNSSSASSKAAANTSYGNVNIGGISLPGYSTATSTSNVTRWIVMGSVALLAFLFITKRKK